jgi:hypothetical protein
MNPVFPKGKPIIEFESQWPPWRNWPPRFDWPNEFRRFMFWMFLVSLLVAVANILRVIYERHAFPFLRNVLIGPVFWVFQGTVSGVAAWTIWKADASARGWAIVASLTFIQIFLRQFIIPVRTIRLDTYSLLELFVGLIGLASFAWPDKQADSSHANDVE